MFDGMISIVPTVMAFFMASLLFFVSRSAKKFDNIFDDQPVTFWALGFFFMAIVWLQGSILSYLDHSPGNVITFLNNLLFAFSNYLWSYGVWLRNRMRFPWQWFLSILAVELICIFSFVFVNNDYNSRITVLYGTSVLTSLITVLAIFRYPGSRYGDRLLIFGFITYCVYNLIIVTSFTYTPADSFFNNANSSVDLLKTFAPIAYALLGVCLLGVMLLDVIEELSKKSRHDYLTGLYNRFGFEHAYSEALEKSKRVHSKGMVLVLVDLDKFKAINDQYGHSVGDKALSWYSQLLLDSCRKSDVVGRLGGDEFVMLLWDCDMQQSKEFLHRFSNRCKVSPVPNLEQPVFVSASYGICDVSRHGTLDEVILCADRNLYSAKDSDELCRG